MMNQQSLSDQESPQHSLRLPTALREDGSMNPVVYEEVDDVGVQILPNTSCFDAKQMRIDSGNSEVFKSYDELQHRVQSLEEAKNKILSYTPGAWIGEGGMELSDYNVPKTTTLLLIGSTGSGKSSLVNKISRVFEVDKLASERAQVSHHSRMGDGTRFLREYMIPRGSTSFCLYDTRGLYDDSPGNMKMLKRWMTKGVRDGEIVIMDYEGSDLKSRKSKARQYGYRSREIRMVNFVVFVVNGLSVLKCMNTNGISDWQMKKLVNMFNCPFLPFNDDKPVVVVTHGDLLSLSDRACVRVHLGEVLGIPAKKQIFDIPESCDPATELTIIDMLRYSLEHADRNLPAKKAGLSTRFCFA